MDVTATYRDIADFFRINLIISSQPLIGLSSVIAWADSVILASEYAVEWMIELSLAKTREEVIQALSRVPPPATDYLGASILVAFVDRQWRADEISREDVCHWLWELREELPSEHYIPATAICSIIDIAYYSCSDMPEHYSYSDMPDHYKSQFDDELSEFFALYRKHDRLIPAGL